MHLLPLTAGLPGATRWGSPTRAIGLQASVRDKEACTAFSPGQYCLRACPPAFSTRRLQSAGEQPYG